MTDHSKYDDAIADIAAAVERLQLATPGSGPRADLTAALLSALALGSAAGAAHLPRMGRLYTQQVVASAEEAFEDLVDAAKASSSREEA